MSDVNPHSVRTAWTFFSNHAHVLVAIAHDPEVRVRDLATLVGVTERAILQIIADLVGSGVLVRSRIGRRTHYAIDDSVPLRHPLERHRTVGDIIALIEAGRPPSG